MRIRLYDARIMTMKDGCDVFKGEIWVKDSRIEKIVKNQEKMDAETFDQEIDCMGNLLMPGFKNCHAHGPMTFLRSFADDLPLNEWLHEKIFPAEAKLTGEDIYHLMKLAILEYIRGGITTSFEMYFHPDMIAKACEELGFPVVISGTVFGSDERETDAALKTLRNDYLQFSNQSEFVDYRLGFHSEYSCCKQLLVAIANLSQELKAPVYMHCSETKREVDECINRYGVTPIALMDSMGMFENKGAGHHMVYTTQEDREIMMDKGIYAVTNPSSNLKLASGIAPVKEYIECGIPVAIGTDGPASNNSLNFFKEMYLTCCLSKVKYGDAAAISPIEVLKMATVNGAKLLGKNDTTILDEGMFADIIMIDLLKPNMQPLNHIEDNLVYSGSVDNVLMTMIHGNILYANGTYHLNTNPIDIYEQANYIIRRIEYDLLKQ